MCMNRKSGLKLHRILKKGKNNKNYPDCKKYKIYYNDGIKTTNLGHSKLSNKEINNGKIFDDTKINHDLHDRTKWYASKKIDINRNNLRSEKKHSYYL